MSNRQKNALLIAEQWFREYAEHHRAKNDFDKSLRNESRAEFCHRAAYGIEEEDEHTRL